MSAGGGGMSAGLRLAGLDDFITPSQACIKPIEAPKAVAGATVSIQMEEDGGYTEASSTGDKVKLKAAKISLTDCLACSGCITSAESVLITQQSADEFLATASANPPVSEGGKLIAVSLSPQAVASIAAHLGISSATAGGLVSTLFRSLGASVVLDIDTARDVSLLEACHECSIKLGSGKGPLLVSACPGWVCYAEKTQHEALPFMSSAKSPQQIAGTLIKGPMAAARGLNPSQIYHLTVMPCFDKKLEASREDFFNQVHSTRDVDLVLTSAEVIEILTSRSIDLGTLTQSPLDSLTSEKATPPGDGMRWGATGFSGGYAEEAASFLMSQQGVSSRVFETQADADEFMQHSGPEHSVSALVWKQARNSDFHELSLPTPGGDGKPIKIARCNGFRNIQNIIRQIKSAKGCQYALVEIMACPQGCINGGGQIRADEDSGESPKERLEKAKAAYRGGVVKRGPMANPEVAVVYRDVIGGEPHSGKAVELFHTQYTARNETLLNPLAIQW